MKDSTPKESLAKLLSMTKAQFKTEYPLYDNFVVGALIFKPSPSTPHKLLLLKRAAHDPAFPNLFAIPGGHVEESDESAFHGLEREVLEETSLVVREVVDQIKPLIWTTETNVKSVQLIFVCDVVGETFRVDPEEHSMGVWAGREEAVELEMSSGMRKVVGDAFKWREETTKGKGKV